MPETTFSIAYDGPALETGRMPVRDLAPALLALGDAFSLASGILEPDLEPVAVNVEATREGSFLVHLIVEGEAMWDKFVGLLSSTDANALLNLVDAVVGTAGLVAVIKRVAGRKVSRVDHTQDPGTVRLTLDDQTTLELPTDTWTLYRKVEMRQHTREVIRPLDRPGVDTVSFKTSDSEIVIDASDVDAFHVEEGEQQEALLDTEQELYVEIVAPTFIRTNKWRIDIGGHVFWAKILDDDFLDRVESGEEGFRKGDLMKCLISIVQTRDAEGLHTEYEIVQVLEHLPAASQLTLGEPEDGS